MLKIHSLPHFLKKSKQKALQIPIRNINGEINPEKNLVEISRNLARYRSKNNFVGPSKLCRKLKHDKKKMLQKILIFKQLI